MTFDQHIPIPEKSLPIVVVGAGGIVRDAHVPAYKMAGFRVRGIFDIDYEKSKNLHSEFECIEKVYGSLRELISDAVQQGALFDIAVPAGHVLNILRQLPDGVAVLIQKPMGETLQEATEIRELCQKKKLVAAINFQLRFAPYCILARHIIESGAIGRLFDLEIKVRVHTPWELWDFLKTLPRLEILYHSIHYLDLVRSFWGNPDKVYANTVKHPKNPSLAATRSSMVLNYGSDRQARILTDHGHDYAEEEQQSYFLLQGTKGAIKIIIGLSLDYPRGKPPKLTYILSEDASKGWQEIPLSGGWFPNAFVGSMAVLQNHFLDSSQPLPHSIKDAYDTMRLVEAAYVSSEQGGIRMCCPKGIP